MSDSWSVIVMPLIVSVLGLTVPGIAVMAAGWGVRRLRLLALAPVVSIAILGISATLAPLLGLGWSPLPILLVTLLAAGAAFGLRRWVGPEPGDRTPRAPFAWGLLALAAAAVAIALQMISVFGAPGNISQTFDAIVHLNTVAYAVAQHDASAFHIGATSDIGFYPNGWHTVAALAAEMTGVSVPVAVNAATIALGAVAWPVSVVALSAALLGERTAVLVSSAALSTGFGAFPLLLLYFGVLYPNAMGYAVLPGGIAAVVHLLRVRGVAARVRAGVLVLAAAAGVGLSHPNAFLAMVALSAAIVVVELIGEVWAQPTRRGWIRVAAILAALALVMLFLWRFSRTGYDMSRWGPWQSTAQAVGEAILLSPRSYPITITISLLMIVGLITVVRRPRRNLVVLAPWVVASVMFVLVSGTGVGNPIRELVTNPWYNDSFRLAALLPVAGIPLVVLGALTVVDLAAAALTSLRAPGAVRGLVAAVGVVIVFSVAVSPNVLRTANDARDSFALTPTSALLTSDEEALLERLPETTPADAVIAGSAWTGASLAYAIGDREVLRKHVFGNIGADEQYLDNRLKDIDSDPKVCQVVDRLGVDYVLDFGAQNVWNNPGVGLDRQGLYGLTPSAHLVLVDAQGPDARLFRIEGC
ncbi:MAG: hypothetical protein BGO45_00710 [Microbacterium sp. 71-36]|uniref:DUF6541 family protein n=1 Tax=unclassified Microbacterium TaxID=2609290 RepID=UPI00086CFEB4|nr:MULTISPECIES: DUF6541 family protein [unclassified Microbacterium]MBN9210069.1 hypothetical protein [Microbacterium sp.]ODT39808.1 MAG: hypothetical protein ABS60_05805 [Microbacterium sp. SCN 71-17]OJV76122.1 MAG: hypothetical protein BGO45_00710 [Microbacterium sp. 71-36]